MKYTPPSQNTTRPPAMIRSGFTMIELLIVVAILLLLVTFTVVAIDFTFESERVRSGARQVQSVIEGARDRAIKARQQRGVRFLLDDDPDSGRMVSTVVHIGATEPWTQGQITLKRPDLNYDGVVDPPNALMTDPEKVWVVDGDANTLWATLKQRGFMGVNEDLNNNGAKDAGEDINGNGILDQELPRIKIPGDRNGTWYHVNTVLLGKNAQNPNRLVLTRGYRDPGTTPPDEVIAFEGTGPNTYILELPPKVLADAEPVILPQGVVIDLDASVVPQSWRPGGTGYTLRYSNRMDLMFTPRGTVVGDAAGAGLVHFYIARRSDVQTCMTGSIRSGVASGGTAKVPSDYLFPNIPSAQWSGSKAPTLGDRSIVSVFAATGKVGSHPLDTGDLYNNNTGASGADGLVDDPYLFAERGEVSGK